MGSGTETSLFCFLFFNVGDQKVHISVDRDPAPMLDFFAPVSLVGPFDTTIPNQDFCIIRNDGDCDGAGGDPTVPIGARQDFNLQTLMFAAQNFFWA